MKPSSDSSSSTSVFHSPESAFLDAMRAAGLDYSGPIIADGVLHRFKVNGDLTENSFYNLHLDGIAAGHFGCWKRGVKENWCAVNSESLTDEQRAERDRRWKQQQAKRDAERRRYQAEAATKAQAILDTARPATSDHPYLVKKAVKAAPGLLVGRWLDRENCLLLPLRTAAGQLATLQAISPDAPFAHSGQTKDFLKGGAKAGAYFVIGDLDSSPIILLTEGYATAATLHEATGYAAVMCCDAGGIKPVAQALKTLYPHPQIILICGDNDRFTEGNPGVKAARSASKAAGVRVIIPEFADDEVGTDFNDLATRHGLEGVRTAIDAAMAGRWQVGKEKVAGAESAPPPAKPNTDTKAGADRDDVPAWFGGADDSLPPPIADAPVQQSGWKRKLMHKQGSTQLLKNHYNAVMVVEYAFPGLVGYNEFRQRIEARIESPWRKEPGQWTDADTGELAFHIAKEYASFTLDALSAAIMTVAHRHKFNPAQERLRGLAEQWDGQPRIDRWLVDDLGAAHNTSNEAYLREIGSAWLKGTCARVLFPGCKRDDVLILRGEQGYLKSTAVQCIADAIHPDAFNDSIGNLDNKDAKSAIRGIIIAELGELSVLNKTDMETIKQFVATRTDHFREAYGRLERDFPRTVSFIGTTNHPTFLKDPTGNRRWWPVTIPAPIDIPRLTAVLPQLVGEAARRVLDGEPWYVNDQTALVQAEAVRAAHFQDDVWTEAALNAAAQLLAGGQCPRCKGGGWKDTSYPDVDGTPGQCFQCHGTGKIPGAHAGFVTVAAILNFMGVRIEQQTVASQTRVGGILRVAGWNDRKTRIGPRAANKTVWAWFPPVVPPGSVVPPVVPPTRPRQTAAVPPVPPGSPYLEDLTEMENREEREPGRDSAPVSKPAHPFQGFIENRGQPGEPGEPVDKQRLPVVPPSGSPSKQGEPTDDFIPHHPALSPDAAALAGVLTFYRGWAEPGELARKSGLGGIERTLTAAQELANAGLASIERGMVKPTARLVEVRS